MADDLLIRLASCSLAAKDQREQIPLPVSQRRKRVHYSPDIGVQVIVLIPYRTAAMGLRDRPLASREPE